VNFHKSYESARSTNSLLIRHMKLFHRQNDLKKDLYIDNMYRILCIYGFVLKIYYHYYQGYRNTEPLNKLVSDRSKHFSEHLLGIAETIFSKMFTPGISAKPRLLYSELFKILF
jgi:hypothetical protein